jgi:hypothetical protein
VLAAPAEQPVSQPRKPAAAAASSSAAAASSSASTPASATGGGGARRAGRGGHAHGGSVLLKDYVFGLEALKLVDDRVLGDADALRKLLSKARVAPGVVDMFCNPNTPRAVAVQVAGAGAGKRRQLVVVADCPPPGGEVDGPSAELLRLLALYADWDVWIVDARAAHVDLNADEAAALGVVAYKHCPPIFPGGGGGGGGGGAGGGVVAIGLLGVSLYPGQLVFVPGVGNYQHVPAPPHLGPGFVLSQVLTPPMIVGAGADTVASLVARLRAVECDQLRRLLRAHSAVPLPSSWRAPDAILVAGESAAAVVFGARQLSGVAGVHFTGLFATAAASGVGLGGRAEGHLVPLLYAPHMASPTKPDVRIVSTQQRQLRELQWLRGVDLALRLALQITPGAGAERKRSAAPPDGDSAALARLQALWPRFEKLDPIEPKPAEMSIADLQRAQPARDSVLPRIRARARIAHLLCAADAKPLDQIVRDGVRSVVSGGDAGDGFLVRDPLVKIDRSLGESLPQLRRKRREALRNCMSVMLTQFANQPAVRALASKILKVPLRDVTPGLVLGHSRFVMHADFLRSVGGGGGGGGGRGGGLAKQFVGAIYRLAGGVGENTKLLGEKWTSSVCPFKWQRHAFVEIANTAAAAATAAASVDGSNADGEDRVQSATSHETSTGVLGRAGRGRVFAKADGVEIAEFNASFLPQPRAETSASASTASTSSTAPAASASSSARSGKRPATAAAAAAATATPVAKSAKVAVGSRVQSSTSKAAEPLTLKQRGFAIVDRDSAASLVQAVQLRASVAGMPRHGALLSVRDVELRALYVSLKCNLKAFVNQLESNGDRVSVKQIYETTHNITTANCNVNGTLNDASAAKWWAAAKKTLVRKPLPASAHKPVTK